MKYETRKKELAKHGFIDPQTLDDSQLERVLQHWLNYNPSLTIEYKLNHRGLLCVLTVYRNDKSTLFCDAGENGFVSQIGKFLLFLVQNNLFENTEKGYLKLNRSFTWK